MAVPYKMQIEVPMQMLQEVIRSSTDLTLQQILLSEGRLNSIIAVSGGAVIKTTDTTV